MDWPLETDERLLWEGQPDPKPDPVTRGMLRRLAILAILLFLVFILALHYRISLSGDTFTIPCADPKLSELALPMTFLTNGVAAFGCAPLFILAMVLVPAYWNGWILRQTRIAVTNRRLLIRRLRLKAYDRSAVRALFRAIRPFAPKPGTPPDPHITLLLRYPLPGSGRVMDLALGPFPRDAGLACEAALHGMSAGSPTVYPPAHRFPSWMDAEERRWLTDGLSSGERLLWAGRPSTKRDTVATAVIAAALLILQFQSGIPQNYCRLLHTCLFRIGGPVGWLAGGIGLGAPTLWVNLLFLYLIAAPFLPQKLKLRPTRERYLVTDRRVIMRGGVFTPDRTFPPVVKRAGKGCSFIRFIWLNDTKPPPQHPSIFFTNGFASVADTDLPAALSAIGEMRAAPDPFRH